MFKGHATDHRVTTDYFDAADEFTIELITRPTMLRDYLEERLDKAGVSLGRISGAVPAAAQLWRVVPG